MWIRSQDREMLINCECFEILDEDTIWIIYGCNTTLARYSTEEKALKVLDELQDIIDQQEEFKAQGEDRRNNNSYRRMIKFVFQMPTDEEVKGGEKGD